MGSNTTNTTKTANPRDSLKSTWVTDRSQWTLNHRVIHFFNAYPLPPGTQPPVHAKTDPVPYFVEWRSHVWVLLHASMPLLLHQIILSITGARSLPPPAVVALYFFGFNWSVVRQIRAVARLGLEIGYLDGDVHARDGVPDVGVAQVVASLWKMTGSRMIAAVLLSYDGTSPATTLASPRWWARLWLQVGLYGIVLDFWFYVYHRAMHDVPALWRFHRTHHLTKHPNALLSAYADHAQEAIDMVCVPLAAWFTFRLAGMPLGFYEWWVCQQYVTFTEVLGHSGLRAYGTPPSTLTWALRLLGAELSIEDHDLHHRTGWRSSHNYGKQTRLWDRVFGTCHDRVECEESNVEWTKGVHYAYTLPWR
jgi:sterol desaturase/sphingolipid hydroxylase (fatty acid hydroxylase superfamily)